MPHNSAMLVADLCRCARDKSGIPAAVLVAENILQAAAAIICREKGTEYLNKRLRLAARACAITSNEKIVHLPRNEIRQLRERKTNHD